MATLVLASLNLMHLCMLFSYHHYKILLYDYIPCIPPFPFYLSSSSSIISTMRAMAAAMHLRLDRRRGMTGEALSC